MIGLIFFPPRYDAFIDTILDLNFTQHILQVRRSEAVLDLIFCNCPDFVSNVDSVEPLNISDHNVFFCELNLSIANSEHFQQNHQYIYNYRKANWELYMEYLVMVNWNNISST